MKKLKYFLRSILSEKLIIFITLLRDFVLNKHIVTYATREWVYNKIHFKFFIFYNQISYTFKISEDLLKKNNESKFQKYSRELTHSPLLRLRKLLNEIQNHQKYNFVDIGHGLGIPLFYVFKKYNFKSYLGIEINKQIFCYSKKNLKKIGLESKIKLKHISAHKFKLDEDKQYIIYLYNPFENFVLKKFLDNNHKNIKKNKSKILISGDKTKNNLAEYNFKKKIVSKGLNIYY